MERIYSLQSNVLPLESTESLSNLLPSPNVVLKPRYASMPMNYKLVWAGNCLATFVTKNSINQCAWANFHSYRSVQCSTSEMSHRLS